MRAVVDVARRFTGCTTITYAHQPVGPHPCGACIGCVISESLDALDAKEGGMSDCKRQHEFDDECAECFGDPDAGDFNAEEAEAMSKLDDIKARWARRAGALGAGMAAEDIAWLVAEVERLRSMAAHGAAHVRWLDCEDDEMDRELEDTMLKTEDPWCAFLAALDAKGGGDE